MADRLLLTNDTINAPQGQGIVYDDDNIYIPLLANAASAHGTGAVTHQFVAGPMPQAGRIVDFAVGVSKIAVSASGFVSANVSANLRVNSVSCLTTLPNLIGPVTSSNSAIPVATNKCSAGNGVSAVVNPLSANFSAGDFITVDFNAQSAGSAAATQAGTGAWALVKIRYAAQ